MAQDIQVKDQYYLTRAQYEAKKTARQLEIGAQYYITDENYATVTYVDTQVATKANINHNQAASTITAGTFAGQVNANTDAVATTTTSQVRNITISTATPTSADGNDGDIWITYIA